MSPHQKYTVTHKKALEWAETQPLIANYLSKLNADKERTAQNLYIYCEWAKKTPEELLELKNDYKDTDAEKLLDRFIREKQSFPDTRKWHIMMRVRGFYRANYRELHRAAGAMQYPNPKDQGSPTKKNRKALIGACYNPRDKAIVMLSSCSAMALETLSKLRWNNFEEDWINQQVPHISLQSNMLKGHGKGKYRGVRQETFITPETKTVLLEYRDWFTKNHEHQWKDDDYVFLQVKKNVGEPLTYLMIAKRLVELSERAGVSFSVHDGRRIVQTALESVGTSSNWIKKIKGRKCSGEESPYSKPAIEQLRAKYIEALPELEFLTEQTPAIKELSNGLEAKTNEIAELKEKLAKIEASREGLTALLKRVEELEKKLMKS